MNTFRYPEDWVARTDGLKLDSPLSAPNLELTFGTRAPADSADMVSVCSLTHPL
jgi:hypothetical protein